MFDFSKFKLHIDASHQNKIQKDLFYGNDKNHYQVSKDSDSYVNKNDNKIIHSLNYQIMKSILVNRPNRPY